MTNSHSIKTLVVVFLYFVSQHLLANTFIKMSDDTRVKSVQMLDELRYQHSDMLQGAQGVLIGGIVPDSQASALDIQPGDIIVSYAGTPINNVDSFLGLVSRLATKNDNVDMIIVRNNKKLIIKLKNGKVGVWTIDVVSLYDEKPSKNESKIENDKSQIFVQLGFPSVCVSVSPDGRLVLSGSKNTIKLWDIATGKEIRTFSGHNDRVASVEFSPNGRYALSASFDGNWRIWDVNTGNTIRSFKDEQQILPVYVPVAFSPDGRQIVSGGVDKKIKLWDIATGLNMRTMTDVPGEEAPISSVAFSPNGLKILSTSSYSTNTGWGGMHHVLKLWDVQSGQLLHTMDEHSSFISTVAFSPDNRYAMSGGFDNTIKIWDLISGKAIRSMKGHNGTRINTVAFSQDGKQALSSGVDGVKLWDIDSGKVIQTFKGISEAAVFTKKSQQVISVNMPGEMQLLDISSGTVIRNFNGHSFDLTSVSFNFDGTKILSSGLDTTGIWDFSNGKMLKGASSDMAFSTVFSNDGHHILSGHVDKTLKLKDSISGELIRTFLGHSGVVKSISFSHDGRRAISIAGHTNSMWKGIQSTQHDHTIRIWDVFTGENIRTLTASGDSITNYAIFSPDAKQVLSSSGVEGMKLWDIESDTLIYQFKNDSQAAAFSPDGKFILSTSLDNSIRLYNLQTKEEIRRFTGHLNFVKSVAFSPDGKRALSGSRDATIKLWDVTTGKEIQTMQGHSAEISSVSFSPDGRFILSGSLDSTARVWNATSGKEIIQHIQFKNGEWISITPEGYFTASSAKASENLNIRMGMSVYGIDQFYDVFYRPDIVESALAGNDTSGMVTLTIEDAIKNPPPVIEKVDVPTSNALNTVNITYKIKSNGGGIGDVRVFHNGKLIKSDEIKQTIPDEMLNKKTTQVTSESVINQMRGLVRKNNSNTSINRVVITPPKPDLYESSVDIEPIPGENDISVIAFNAQNSIQSIMQTKNFVSKKPIIAPRLYILAIGIDEYKDTTSNLKYAVKDSNDITAHWKSRAANIYGAQNIFTETITNAQANREGILKKISEIASRIKPTDHFVLFVAGHGVLLGEQYYMVTSNYNGAIQNTSLISANEIVDFSKRIKALSQLYILDTCHAGGMSGIISGLYDARISVLAKKMGLHVFASASSVEEALDGFEGNGLFTHTLLSGLNNNKQVDKNSNKQISLIELGDYSKKQTKDIAKTLNHTQDPLMINFGQDDPVYMLE